MACPSRSSDYAETADQELGQAANICPHTEDLNPNTKFVDNRDRGRVDRQTATRSPTICGGPQARAGRRRPEHVKHALPRQLAESDYLPKDYMDASGAFVRRRPSDCSRDFYARSCRRAASRWTTRWRSMSILWSRRPARYRRDHGPAYALDDLRASQHTRMLPLLPARYKSDDDAAVRPGRCFARSLVGYGESYQDYVDKYHHQLGRRAHRLSWTTSSWRHGDGRTDRPFPSIPVKVTLDEYIEIAEVLLVRPAAASFINGVLDKIVDSLTAEGRIRKSGRGLIRGPMLRVAVCCCFWPRRSRHAAPGR